MREPFSFSDRWIKWKDVERCPYIPKDPQYKFWIRDDDKRLKLAALDNYADYLKKNLSTKQMTLEKAAQDVIDAFENKDGNPYKYYIGKLVQTIFNLKYVLKGEKTE